jgi:hypothetical protein
MTSSSYTMAAQEYKKSSCFYRTSDSWTAL